MDLKVKTTVLIVDDEESIREILKYNLEREKFEVFEAADGEEAIRMCTEHRPNLILLDIIKKYNINHFIYFTFYLFFVLIIDYFMYIYLNLIINANNKIKI